MATRFPHSVAHTVRTRIERAPDRTWRHQDFSDLPPAAVAQALSRLARSGFVTRLGKGLYFRPRATALGPSRPNPAALRRLAETERPLFPAGLAAANLLGFTTQSPARLELATPQSSLPRLLVGQDATILTRRPAAWNSLSQEDAALLDFLRRRGETSELAPAETVRRLLRHCAERGRWGRLVRIAASEPPRVRALLGAIGQQLGQSPRQLRTLHATLNPLSRFDFGILQALKFAPAWQAKQRLPRRNGRSR